VSRASSLPAGIPGLLARRPHLAAALLRWRNAYHFRRARVLCVAALIVALAAGLVAAPPTGPVLGWLAGNPPITFLISACLFGVAAVRRRARMQLEAATSWLAALPAPGSAVLRLVSKTLAGILAAACFVGIASVDGRMATGTAWGLVLVTAAGALVGTLVGWLLQGRAAKGSAHWQYAAVRRARRRWATAPSLSPLSCWPVAQGRIFSRPRTTSIVVLMVLLSIPSGRYDPPGQVAIAVAAGTITLFTLLMLSAAAVRVAGDAARWLAPAPIRLPSFIGAFVWRVVLKQAAMLAVVVFLACAVDYPRALRMGLALSVAYVVISCAAASVACAWACRQAGLGTARRGH
jgi:hypothetical protein